MKKITLSKKELRHRLNTLKINSEGLKPRKYGVSAKYFSENISQHFKRIHYKLIAELKIVNGDGIVRLAKKNIFYNQHRPELINEIISDRISTSIFPIGSTINERGVSNYEVLNYEEITKRWKQSKSLLS